MTAFLLFFACAEPDTTIDISQLDQTCEVAEDCMAVFVGSACGCDCTREGINVADADAYNELWQESYDACDTDEILECVACDDVDVSCDAGVCIVTPLSE
jgi:hypothetical protein